MNSADPADILRYQLETQGVGVIQVSDGHVLMLSTETLEKLLEASKEDGKVILFVKHQVMDS